MHTRDVYPMMILAILSASALAWTGCDWPYGRPKPHGLGAISDQVWCQQEHNAEASDFVIYDHEFKKDGTRLNTAGEDHLKQIVARLQAGQDFPVLVERTMCSADPDSEYKYPVHPNPKLDMARREVVVRAMSALGVPDADQRVVVSPALTAGMSSSEAEAAYQAGMQGINSNAGGMGLGGGFGGFMFRGGY